jgi:hypothetical protein
MTRLEWNKTGDRFFEAGVDRGVFFAANGTGIPWNGLVSVNEAPSGGEPTPYYIDGVKYLNIAELEEYGGTIEAYTYPERFADYDGSVELHDGLSINLQERQPFGLSYRTRIGNDLEGVDYGYKIHIIYNVLVSPSTRAYSTIGGSLDPINFSWNFTTTPVYAGNNYRRTAHVLIDSTKTSSNLIRAVEDHIYGSSTRSPKLIDLEKLIYWFESGGEPLEILPHTTTGMAELIQDGKRDLVTTEVEGLHTKLSDSRLTETTTPGLYTLET